MLRAACRVSGLAKLLVAGSAMAATAAAVVGDRKTFTAYLFALTNPVFLDVDGDGRYRTGLPHGH